jgi:hypothetical protein
MRGMAQEDCLEQLRAEWCAEAVFSAMMGLKEVHSMPRQTCPAMRVTDLAIDRALAGCGVRNQMPGELHVSRSTHALRRFFLV